MTLRMPNPFNNSQTLLDLQRTKERFAELQQQISTGKRIVRLGDDPTGAALVIDFKNSVERNDEHIRLIQSARNLLRSSETALGSVDTGIVRLLELGQQGLSSTTGAAGRAKLSSEVDGIRNNILSVANTQVGGKYLFAGTRTLTQPFSGPAAGPITYSGDSNAISVDVSLGVPVATNLTGDTVFFGAGGQGSGTDIFQAVTDMRDGLATNNMTLIQSAYDRLQVIQDHFSDMVTDLGGRQSSIDQLEDNLAQYTLSLKAIQGTYEDLDYPSAITEFTKVDNIQQASLSALARSSRQSLFDYLG